MQGIVRNVTDDIIATRTNGYRNCFMSDAYNISIAQSNEQMTVNATIVVCDQSTQNALYVVFISNIQPDFIVAVNQETGLVVASEGITVSVTELYVEPEGIVDTTTTQNPETADSAGGGEKSSSTVWIVIGALIIGIAIGAVIGYRVKRSRKAEQTQQSEVASVEIVGKGKHVQNVQNQDDVVLSEIDTIGNNAQNSDEDIIQDVNETYGRNKVDDQDHDIVQEVDQTFGNEAGENEPEFEGNASHIVEGGNTQQ